MLKFFQEKNSQIISAYVSMIFIVFLVLFFKVVPAILAGLLAYVLTTGIMQKMNWKTPNNTMKEKIVGIVVGLLSFAFLGTVGFLIAKALSGENITGLIGTLADTISKAKEFFPEGISEHIPDTVEEIKASAMNVAKSHFNSIADMIKIALHELLLVVIGWLIGILVACKRKDSRNTDFSRKWNDLWYKLSDAFKFVVFAQVKVATFNSMFMAIFLFIFCPIFGWDIPYSKLLVLITFICGLLPIIGNLISNTISFLMAMTVSLPAAIAALCMLMLIHKLEYLIISKSLGADIDSDIWELLIILFSFEILFGVAGMVFSPILYAFFKKEMRSIDWLK